MPIGPAAAQSFVEGLFGNDPTASPRAAAGHLRRQPLGSPAYAPYDQLAAPDGDTYRTLCVRMCDGFYFPISYATGSAAFTRDAEACAAACGEDARLFYYPNPGGDIEDMVDLTGRSYASYPTAFRYRKTLVKGCQCRPQPWTEAERARHRAYVASQIPPAGPWESSPAPADSFPASGAVGAEGDDQPSAQPPIDRSTLTSIAPVPAISPYVAGAPASVAARRNPPAGAERPQEVEAGQWGWSPYEAGARIARRKVSPAWRNER